jgi:N-acetyl-anhydromuramyl-L-alanine amidase AmpD
MFPFKKDLSKTQRHYSKWVENTCDYIIVHHTATPPGTLNGNIKVLTGTDVNGVKYETKNPVSAFALIDSNGDAYKLSDPKQVTWHAGTSNWGTIVWLNYHGIGIEVIWPGFTAEQRATTRKLIQHLMAVFKIPKENILRHADLCHKGSTKKQLWDGISPSRKNDIDSSFWKIDRTTWKQYQDSLIPKEI